MTGVELIAAERQRRMQRMYWQGRYDAADAIEEFAEDSEHTVEHVQALTAAAQIARGSDECTAAVHDADRLTTIEGTTPL